MRSPEAWRELNNSTADYLTNRDVLLKPPTLAQKINDNRELLAGTIFLGSLQFGGSLIMLGNEAWKNIGAVIVIGTVTIPVATFLAVRATRGIHSLIEHTRSAVGEYFYDCFKHFHQP